MAKIITAYVSDLLQQHLQEVISFSRMVELLNEKAPPRTSDERFVYNKLFIEGIYDKLSPDAKEVLDMATELLKKSIIQRKLLSESHPEYHLDSWDCGYAQLKLVWKEYFKADFEKLRATYKKLEDRMRPLVYKLGFLR